YEIVVNAADEATRNLQISAQEAVDAERATLDLIRQNIRFASNRLRRAADRETDCENFLASFVEANEWATRAFVFNNDGDAVCGAPGPLSIADQDVWARFNEDPRFVVSPPRLGRVSGEPIFVTLHPIGAETAEFFALGVGLDRSFLADLTEVAAGGAEIDFALVHGGGETSSQIAGDADVWLPAEQIDLRIDGDRGFTALGGDGRERLYFVSTIVQSELWAVASTPTPSIAAILMSRDGLGALAPILIWAVAIAVVYFAIDALVVRDIVRLKNAAERLRAGGPGASEGAFEDASVEIRELRRSLMGMASDLAERNETLEETTEVQRRLLQEVHHRVKNNLQIISSMLSLEQSRTRDPLARIVMQVMQNRIHSLALVHQNLYATEQLEQVSLVNLTKDIAGNLSASLAESGRRAEVVSEESDATLGTQVATPVALFLSEALANGFKHGDERANVVVRVARTESEFTISVENPIGDVAQSVSEESLGLKLMRGFAKQIGGRIETEKADGRHRISLIAPIVANPKLFSVRQAAAGERAG
ncbi:MAG: sensor histidine kinase, partial [Pseudomonadota bacterium]